MEIFYVRFGEIPKLEQSMNYFTEQPEPGVSVCKAVRIEGKIHILLPDNPERFSGFADSLANVLDRQCYEVEGLLLDQPGSDGEPLMVGVRIVREISTQELAYPGIVTHNYKPHPLKTRDDPAMTKTHLPLVKETAWFVNMLAPAQVTQPITNKLVEKATASYLHLAGVYLGKLDGKIMVEHIDRTVRALDVMDVLFPSIPITDGTEFAVEFHGNGYGHYRIKETVKPGSRLTEPEIIQIAGNFKEPLVFLVRNTPHKYKLEPSPLGFGCEL